MDAFGKIPEEMFGKFDVVHVRAFGVIVTHSDPMPLLKNLISMLSGLRSLLNRYTSFS